MFEEWPGTCIGIPNFCCMAHAHSSAWSELSSIDNSRYSNDLGHFFHPLFRPHGAKDGHSTLSVIVITLYTSADGRGHPSMVTLPRLPVSNVAGPYLCLNLPVVP